MTICTRGSPPEDPASAPPPPPQPPPPDNPQPLPVQSTDGFVFDAPHVIGVADSGIDELANHPGENEDNGEKTVTSAPPVSPSQSPRLSIPDEDNNGADLSNSSVDVLNDDISDDAEGETPVFPVSTLQLLDEQLNRQRWVVPVLPGQELHVLIDAAIKLCKRRLDVNDEACQRFFKDGLLLSFTRVMNDEAVKEWKPEILRHIYKLSERCLELCVLKLEDNLPPLMEILALMFNAKNKYYTVTQQRESDSVNELWPPRPLFSSSPENGQPKGWLVDLLNKFGQLDGFQKILDRFQSGTDMNCSLICALLKPFGNCYEYLSTVTVETYLQEAIRCAHRYMQNMSDEELKRETKGDARESSPMEIVRYLRNLSTRLPGQDNIVRDLELLRLKIILRILQTSSFAGKMNALNEISKILQSVGSSSSSTYGPSPSEEYLNVQQVVSWIRDNDLLNVAIKENLHIIQYVEKLEKILRFMIKEKTLTIDDLDQLWAAQIGKHDAIVKNIHDLLAKVAWDFAPDQLDHLFECFQRSWNDAGKKQREKLLELIRRLAEDDRDGRVADKVLQLLWNFACSSDIPTDIMDQALQCHAKILDYSCSSQKEQQKIAWLERCIEEIRQNKLALPAMKHFRDICVQFPEGTPYNPLSNPIGQWPNSAMRYARGRVIGDLQNAHALIALIANNLVRYMEVVRRMMKEHEQTLKKEDAPIGPSICIDGHFDHALQVHERLSFLKFVLRDGHLWLCEPQASEIWNTLVVNPVFPVDREAGFKWFVKMMGDMADLDTSVQRLFFEERVLQLDPSWLTEAGMKCYERFFKHVNQLENRLVVNEQRCWHINNFDLIGQEYIWRVILSCNEDIADRAIVLVREVYTNPSAAMIEEGKLIQLHTDFIQSCIDRLKASYDTLSVLYGEKDSSNLIHQETVRMTRVLRVLHGYIVSYDEQCNEDRVKIPLCRASLGRTIDLQITFPNSRAKHQPPAALPPLEILTHTNQTLGGLKRQILQQLRIPAGFADLLVPDGAPPAPVSAARLHIDLMLNGELLDAADDRKTLEEIGLYGRLELQANLRKRGRSGGAGGHGSSPGSSSDDSSPGAGASYDSMECGECENLLPSTWLCQKHNQIDFLLRIADLGSKLDSPNLRDWSRAVLGAIPGDVALVKKITELTQQLSPVAGTSPSMSKELLSAAATPCNSLQNVFFASSPSEVLYSLELTYAMLSPARDLDAEKTLAFQMNFVKAGGIQACLSTLLQNNFLCQTDAATKATAFWYVLRLLRLLLSVVIHVRCTAYTVALQNAQPTNAEAQSTKVQCDYMTAFFNVMPPHVDALCNRLCVAWSEKLEGVNVLPEGNYPDLDHARMIMKLAWAAAGGNLSSAVSPDDVHTSSVKKLELSFPNQYLSRDALEVFILCVILNPAIMDSLLKEKFFQHSIIDLLFCPSDFVRIPAGEFFYYLATKTFCIQPRNLHFFMTLLCTVLFTSTAENSRVCREYFILLRGLLMFANNSHVPFQQVDGLLDKEIAWLKEARNYSTTNMEPYSDDALLEGHLMITRALVGFLPPDRKYYVGSVPDGPMLVKELLEDFLLPSSRMFVEQKSETIHRSLTVMGRMSESPSHPDVVGSAMMPRSLTTIYSPSRCVPVCASAQTVTTAYDLIVALCTNCVANMQTIFRLLSEMYFDDTLFAVTEWEYAPPVNLRNASAFVGLKNGGATCYMNSVFQQLFMIEKLRNSILSSASPNYCVDDSDNEEAVVQGPVMRRSPPPISAGEQSESSSSVSTTEKTPTDRRKDYNMGILQCVQLIFANLLGSQLQFYVPRKFWKQFRFGNDLINLREQHDALEFFNSLVDSVDEALKALGEEQICNKVFGGTFADQKICKGCPHRYTREEPFTTLSLDVRNHHNMIDSLQEYVKGDLLESENAYLCEKCNRKVDAVKRLCIKKLPPVLVIQLKRFDFDWEREQAVKFNDYFEFPREVEMEPYTVEGLAKLDGEILADPENVEKVSESPEEKVASFYKLRGIIVHSGQASGGHYYSFILQRLPNGQQKWYKFDDGDVTECRMDDDEEMRAQCFGGEYTSEVFDQYLRRLQQRRHKRWWNAYILFYERADAEVAITSMTTTFESMTLSGRMRQMPAALEDIVNRKNMKCCHRRNQYTLEFFQFLRQLCSCHFILFRTGQISMEDPNFQLLLLLSTQLVAKFLFTTGLRAKRNLRGNPQEWIDIMTWLFRTCPAGRTWFASEILFKNTHRFSEYLLESPSPDVRLIFARLLANLAHFGNWDSAAAVQNIPERLHRPQDRLSDVIIRAVLALIQKEVSDYGRHLKEYFGFFYCYASFGIEEKRKLLSFNVPALFIRVLLDEGPGPPIKSIAVEFQKLYCTVSLLLRSCDFSGVKLGNTLVCATSDGGALRPNPWQEPVNSPPITPVVFDVVCQLYEPPAKFLKKLLDEAIHLEDTLKLIKFLCWENIHFTKTVFTAILQAVRYSFVDLRPLLDCWLQILLLDDSWAEKRVVLTLREIAHLNKQYTIQFFDLWLWMYLPVGRIFRKEGSVGLRGDDLEGLFHYIQLQMTHNPRRAYLLTKMLASLFDASATALRVLYSHGEMKRCWVDIATWMHSELSAGRPPYSTAYAYSSWSPPAQSNETASGNYLERTKSAKMTLAKVMQIAQNWPADENEETSSGRQSDEDVAGADVDDDTLVMGSVSADVPAHPPPPYSLHPVPPPPPPPPPRSAGKNRGDPDSPQHRSVTKPKDSGEVSGPSVGQAVPEPSSLDATVSDPSPPRAEQPGQDELKSGIERNYSSTLVQDFMKRQNFM